MQAVERYSHVQLDLIAQIGRPDRLLPELRSALRPPRIPPSTVENWNLERRAHAARGKRVQRAGPDIAVVGESAYRRKPLQFRRAEVEPRVLFTPRLRPQLRPMLVGRCQRLSRIHRFHRNIAEP